MIGHLHICVCVWGMGDGGLGGVYLEGEDTPFGGGGTHLEVGNYARLERAKDRVNPRFRTHARRSHFHIYHSSLPYHLQRHQQRIDAAE